MPHRNDLEAAHARIRKLEEELADLKGEKKPPPTPVTKPVAPAGKPGCAVFALLVGLFGLLSVGGVTCGSQGCLRMSDEGAVALAALKKCERARELLGEDIDYSVVGCTNYKSRGGGDPLNGGCTGSSSWTTPVAGSKGRGSYVFSSVKPPGGDYEFTGGTLYVDGEVVMVRADGECDAVKRPR